MPHITPSQTEVRDNILRDIRNVNTEARVADDSDNYIRANATANAIDGLYADQKWVAKQIFADTADDENVIRHAASRGMTLNAAVQAGGQVRVPGVVGKNCPSGLQLRRDDGVTFTTTEAATVGDDGTALVAAKADAAGKAGNTDAGVTLTVMEAPAGIGSPAVVVSMVGGVEQETVAHLLQRYLELLRRPPAGGNKYDYVRWAKEVDGVTDAYAYPLRRGLGTIDVVIASDGGLPSPETIAAAQAHIDDQRCVTAKNSLVLAATLKPINYRIQVKGISIEAAEAAINASLSSYYSGIIPGQASVKSVVEMLVSTIAGITDRNVIEPTGNVIATVDETVVEWLRLGEVIVEPMP